jgi:hypothetical protein
MQTHSNAELPPQHDSTRAFLRFLHLRTSRWRAALAIKTQQAHAWDNKQRSFTHTLKLQQLNEKKSQVRLSILSACRYKEIKAANLLRM